MKIVLIAIWLCVSMTAAGCHASRLSEEFVSCLGANGESIVLTQSGRITIHSRDKIKAVSGVLAINNAIPLKLYRMGERSFAVLYWSPGKAHCDALLFMLSLDMSKILKVHDVRHEVVDLWAQQDAMHMLAVSMDRKEDCGIPYRIVAMKLSWTGDELITREEASTADVNCSNVQKVVFAYSTGQPVAYWLSGEIAGVYTKRDLTFVLEEPLAFPSATSQILPPSTHFSCDMSSDGSLVATAKLNDASSTFDIMDFKRKVHLFHEVHKSDTSSSGQHCISVAERAFVFLDESSLLLVALDGSTAMKRKIPLPFSPGSRYSISGVYNSKCHIISSLSGKETEIIVDF